MISLTAATVPVSQEKANPWMGALYAGLFTAAACVIAALVTQTENWILILLAHILVGIGPVLGYQLALGRLGQDWMALLGGALGALVPVLMFLIWPLTVGLLDRTQSIGRLYLGSILGFILGVAVFLIIGTFIGQDPSWIGTGFTFLWAVWGGTVGAFATAYARI